MGRIVIVGYKPKPGKERELEGLMGTHIPILRSEGLVTDRESIIRRLTIRLRIPFMLLAFVLTANCTTTQEIKRPDGSTEFLIACGASTGWNICYKKANELCPNGYETLAEDAGFNRKELRIACPRGKADSE